MAFKQQAKNHNKRATPQFEDVPRFEDDQELQSSLASAFGSINILATTRSI